MNIFLLLGLLIAIPASADISPPILPSPLLTPGATYTSDATVACNTNTGGESDSIRSVSDKVRQSVFAAYSIPAGNKTGYCEDKGCELDHLISLKLGGSNDEKNLWPQSYAGTKNAIMKDNLEKRLIARVCRTSKLHPVRLSLKEAQHAIATDWVKAYKTYVTNNQ
jgi:hypothetical protein